VFVFFAHDRMLGVGAIGAASAPYDRTRREWLGVTTRTSARMRSDLLCSGTSMNDRSCVFENVCYVPRQSKAAVSDDDDHNESMPTLPTQWVFYRRSVLPHDGLTSQYLSGQDVIARPAAVSGLVTPVTVRTTAVTLNELHSRPFELRDSNEFLPADARLVERPVALYYPGHNPGNPGHTLFESIFPIYAAVENFLGDGASSRTALLSGCRRFCRNSSIDQALASSLFGALADVPSLDQLGTPTCFRALVVGSGAVGGLQGGLAHHWPQLLRMRNAVLHSVGWQPPAASPSPAFMDVLVLNKTATVDRRSGEPAERRQSSLNASVESQLPQLCAELRRRYGYAGLRVTVVEPQKTPYAEQVRLYARSLVTVSVWGGISMLNWLMPPGAVEIVFTNWRADKGYTLNKALQGKMAAWGHAKAPKGSIETECPDWEYRMRETLPHIATVRYCSAAPSRKDPFPVNLTAFVALFDGAIARLCSRRYVSDASDPRSWRPDLLRSEAPSTFCAALHGTV